MEGSCLQLALEGERLCKSGDCVNGVQFFEAAVKSGTKYSHSTAIFYCELYFTIMVYNW